MIPKNEIEKHEKLIKTLEMIDTLETRLVRNLSDYEKWGYQFQSKSSFEEKQTLIKYMISRLQSYYAKQVFALASHTYNSINNISQPITLQNQ